MRKNYYRNILKLRFGNNAYLNDLYIPMRAQFRLSEESREELSEMIKNEKSY